MKADDFGNYSCVADNIIGKNRQYLILSGKYHHKNRWLILLNLSILGERSQVVYSSFWARARNRKNGQKYGFNDFDWNGPFNYTL